MKRTAAYLFALVVVFNVTAAALAEDSDGVIMLPLSSGASAPMTETFVPVEPVEMVPPPSGPMPIYPQHGPMFSQYRGVPTGGLEMGGGVYILKPRWNNNAAYATNSVNGTNLTNSFPEFSYNPELASSAWVGVTNQKGLGVRFRMMNFDQKAETLNASVANANSSIITADPLGLGAVVLNNVGDSATFESGLAISAWDLEMAQQIGIGHLLGTMTGGVRYSHSSQDYIVSTQQLGGITDSLVSGHNFNGIGPLVGMELRYPYEGRYGCISAFGKARGGLLFGDTKQSVQNQQFDAGGTLTDNDTATRSGESVLPVTDIEFGMELGRNIHIAYFFFESSVFAQTWYGIGNSTTSSGVTDASSNDNLGLVGVKMALGFRF